MILLCVTFIDSVHFSHDKYDFCFLALGCSEMTPPDGAWMTRDGDVIEIGCHSGLKTWRLECNGSEWVGTIGLCGSGLMVFFR